jgi:hypothetical protein
MWAVVSAILNLLLIQWHKNAGKMAGMPAFPRHISSQEILRSIANLPEEHVEEVFQDIARMLAISSVVLDRMSCLLSDMFEDFRDVIFPSRGGRVPNRKPFTSHYKPLPRGRVTRANAKAWKDEARREGGVEEENLQKTESEEERPVSPIQKLHAKVHIIHT